MQPFLDSQALADDMFCVMDGIMKSNHDTVFQLMSDHDFSISQLRVFITLAESPGPYAINHMAKALGYTLPTTGRAVEHLVQAGLIYRTEDAHDRRVKRIALSEKGTELFHQLITAHQNGIKAMVDALSPSEQAALSSAIQPILHRQTEPTL